MPAAVSFRARRLGQLRALRTNLDSGLETTPQEFVGTIMEGEIGKVSIAA
jgi:hypothetical protein